MKISIRMFGRFKQQFWEKRDVDVPDAITPLYVLKEEVATNPEGYTLLFDQEDRLRNHIVLMVNRRRISNAECTTLLLHDKDELAVLPPVAGG